MSDRIDYEIEPSNDADFLVLETAVVLAQEHHGDDPHHIVVAVLAALRKLSEERTAHE